MRLGYEVVDVTREMLFRWRTEVELRNKLLKANLAEAESQHCNGTCLGRPSLSNAEAGLIELCRPASE